MTPILRSAVALLLSVSVACALDPEPPLRPIGVDEALWSPITKTFGFVITKDLKTGTNTDPKTGKPRKYVIGKQVSGYFMILREGLWTRVDVEPSPATFMPLAPH